MKNLLSLLFSFWFSSTIWTVSTNFIDHETEPKWYIAWGGAGILLWIMLFLQLFCPRYARFRFKTLAYSILFCTVSQALYGIWQWYDAPSSTISGSFDNPAGLASLLAFVLPFGCYGGTVKQKWLRYCAITGTLILCLSLLLTDSRAGILCAAIILFLYPLRHSHISRKKLTFIGATIFACASIFLYLYKKDSADGRLLIWQCTYEMIKDQPWIGFGTNGFQINYMNYQAEFFRQHPDCRYAILADNIKHPFNEYLLLMISYGFIGILFLLITIILLVRAYQRNNCKSSYTATLCLVAIALFSLFSYPFRYPHTWIMCILSISILLYNAYKYPNYIRLILTFVTAFYVTIRSILYIPLMKAEMEWSKVADRSLCGMTEEMLPVYDKLHDMLHDNPLFLYNYAAELNVAGHYEKSLKTSQDCEKVFADYYLQLLLADNYKKVEQYTKAEQHLKQASFMCPNRFVPLYELFLIYENQQNYSAMRHIGHQILQKKIKIKSTEVHRIIMEVKRKLEKDQ